MLSLELIPRRRQFLSENFHPTGVGLLSYLGDARDGDDDGDDDRCGFYVF